MAALLLPLTWRLAPGRSPSPSTSCSTAERRRAPPPLAARGSARRRAFRCLPLAGLCAAGRGGGPRRGAVADALLGSRPCSGSRCSRSSSGTRDGPSSADARAGVAARGARAVPRRSRAGAGPGQRRLQQLPGDRTLRQPDDAPRLRPALGDRALTRCLRRRGEAVPKPGALGLLAAAASAAKTTVLPAVVAALALVAIGLASAPPVREARRFGSRSSSRRSPERRSRSGRTSGPESYSGMAKLGFASGFHELELSPTRSRSGSAPARRLAGGSPCRVRPLARRLSAGCAGVAAALWIVRHGWEALGPSRPGRSAPSAPGSPPGLVLVNAPGMSAALPALQRTAAARALRRRGLVAAFARPRRLADGLRIAALGLLARAVPTVHQVARRACQSSIEQDRDVALRAPSPVERDYATGLAWLRVNASRGAVVWADNPSLLLSALGEVRLYLRERDLLGPRLARRPRARNPGPSAWRSSSGCCDGPTRTCSPRRRLAVGPGPRLLVVADSVQSSVESASWGRRSARSRGAGSFRRRSSSCASYNGAMQVYEARR